MKHLQRRPRRLTITVSEHVYEQLLYTSSQQGRSLSNYAAYMLENALDHLSTPGQGSDRLDRVTGLVDSSRPLQPLPVLRHQVGRGLNPDSIAKTKQPVA